MARRMGVTILCDCPLSCDPVMLTNLVQWVAVEENLDFSWAIVLGHPTKKDLLAPLSTGISYMREYRGAALFFGQQRKSLCRHALCSY